MTMRQPKCGTDARCEGYWTDCGYPSDDVPELVSGDNLSFIAARRPLQDPLLRMCRVVFLFFLFVERMP